jgi:hypothetical protein
VREGIEIRVGLATLTGLDERPGEIPGLGPVDAGVARTAVAAQQRGAAWKFAIVDTSPSRNCTATAATPLSRHGPRHHPTPSRVPTTNRRSEHSHGGR